ncbi:ABC transporter permease [Spirosoma sordidisoli]|uniref:FtsX-like permease family protein n=1 Tax=Spirosoma sordidisoli TaxID=2502893 RepID=A0A4Q2UI19_9BACT|nr:ABC transporter permease [Spirosoma sordidisoli]RYC68834.1 FtsX-like permease family protein [Spirosoma sordidisoli]
MLTNYLRIAWRNLRAQRNYTFINAVGLTIGMAGGLLIFVFLRHHLSVDRHHAQLDRLFRVNTDLHLADGTIEYNPESPLPMAQTLRRDYPQVEQAAFLIMNRQLTVSIRQPGATAPVRFLEHKGTGLAEPEWFDILSYTWLRGDSRTALREPGSVVLTESWAKKYFGDTNPIGRRMTLNNSVAATVTGVLADPPLMTDTNLGLFISMSTLKQLIPEYDETGWYWLNSTNRLYVKLRQPEAAASLEASFPALSKKHYGADAHVFQFHLQSLRAIHTDVKRGGETIRASLLWALGTIGGLLVLAACINFVNLATVQALRRRKEVGIRKTLGSSRWQLIGQFLLETALITGVAAGLALLLVAGLLPAFADWVKLPLSLRPDWLTAVGVGGLVVSVVLLAGAYPALVLSGFAPWAALRGKGLSATGAGLTVRRVLVVAQFVVCQALLVASVVVASQIRYIQKADLGFTQNNVVVVALPNREKSAREAFQQQLASYPDVRSISFSHRAPASAQLFGGQFRFNGRADWEAYPVRDRLADANYLATYGLTLLAGRNIASSDTIREYLINETLLHKLGFRDPQQVLGKTLQYHLSPVPLPIVGVVKDFHEKSLREPIAPCLIASQSSWYAQAGIQISGRTRPQTMQRIQEVWQRLYPADVFEYQFLDEQVAAFYETETLVARLVNVFTGVAILICCLGLYGLIAHVVIQRTREIGVRKVLGASVTSIVALLSKDFLQLVAVAIVIASPLTWYVMGQWLQGFAYRAELTWWFFALAGLVSVSIALMSISFQSIKAALANPVQSLRSET